MIFILSPACICNYLQSPSEEFIDSTEQIIYLKANIYNLIKTSCRFTFNRYILFDYIILSDKVYKNFHKDKL